MQDPGHLLALNFLLLYSILGPLVLLALYVVFDVLSREEDPAELLGPDTPQKHEPALMTESEVHQFLQQHGRP